VSHYENAIKIKSEMSRVIASLEQQVTTSQRDKTGLRWQFVKIGERYMQFFTDCYAGNYGSSSVSNMNSEALGKEIAKTLTQLKCEIIRIAIERCKKQIADAAALAADEARKVLDEVSA